MNWQNLYDALHDYLHLHSFPVGVTLFPKKSDVPESVRWFDRKVNICQQVAIARLYGWSFASGPAEQVCVLGAASLGLIETPERVKSGEINCGVYQKDLIAARKMQDHLPKMPTRNEAVACFSLTRVPEGITPQVVVIYGNSAQMMRLIQAALWSEGGEFRMASSGDAGVCSRAIAQTIMTQKATMEIPCLGDRRFAAAQDHDIIFAFPAKMSRSLLEGLEGTYRSGSRYPIPVQMDWEPHMPMDFSVADKDLGT